MSEASASVTDSVEDDPEIVLPEPVRLRVVALVADELPALAPDELPPDLRSFARFTPSRRAKLGARAIAARLATDSGFRERVSARVVSTAGELGAAVAAGTPPTVADPVDVAAIAYLARPAGWVGLLDAAVTSVGRTEGEAETRSRERELERLADQLERARTAAKADAARQRADLQAARTEADDLRNRARDLTRALRAAEQDAKKAADALSTERGRAAALTSAQDAELRRMRSRLADVESELDIAKRASKEGRSVDEARLWLLLETIGQAAQGLRRELALNPATQLPADMVAAAIDSGQPPAARQTWAADDPSRLDQLLALPKAHLIVDGYNVTKTGFGEVSLEQQRTRLVTRLGGLAAQTSAEVTVAFDGAERLPVAPASPRGVRVLFSPKGQIADELIRRLVRSEPPGRPVIVVSADKEVADGARRAGAYPVASTVLLERLARG